MHSEFWQQRFVEFVEHKTRKARAAELHPYTTSIDAPDARAIAIGNEWTTKLFDGRLYASPPPTSGRPACSLVFVQSRDGNTAAANPATLGGGNTDAHLIYEGLSRVAADGVMAGAETIRGGDVVFSVWHPELIRLRESLGKPRYPVQILATLRGLDFERALLLNVPDVPVVLVTVPACTTLMERNLDARPWIRRIVMDRPQDLPHAFDELRGMGIERISCVGGRTLARQLIDFGLVQDLYLTTSPVPGGEPDTPFYAGPLPAHLAVRKHGTGPETGVVFEHLVLSSR